MALILAAEFENLTINKIKPVPAYLSVQLPLWFSAAPQSFPLYLFPMSMCVTLSEVLSVPLLAFSLHFGDSNVKTHRLYREQVSVPPGSDTWLSECKWKYPTTTFPKIMRSKLFPHPKTCDIFLQPLPERLLWASRNKNWTLIMPTNAIMCLLVGIGSVDGKVHINKTPRLKGRGIYKR